MQAIILAAGAGKRMRPHTRGVPKPLLKVGPATVLEWQVRALRGAGVRRIVLVTGYRAGQLERAARRIKGIRWRFVRNRLWNRTENIVSFYLAHEELLRGPTFVLMADILFDAGFARSLSRGKDHVRIAVRRRHAYSKDDMKVKISKEGMRTISKGISGADAEYLQVTFYTAAGARRAYRAASRLKREGLRHTWYPAVLQHLADDGTAIRSVFVRGKWMELDEPSDLKAARRDWKTS